MLPIEATANRTHGIVQGSRLVAVEDRPHGLNWTQAEPVNQALLDLLAYRLVCPARPGDSAV
ncbi:MAG: hypothetical protein AB7P40_16055 [Chloroflexota bacterium]